MILLKSLSLLSLLLYSIQNFSSSLDNLAEGKIIFFLNKLTINIFSSFLAGIFICILTQSSSIITILTISLISSGLISLEKGLAVIIGSNIGTTLTSLFFSINPFNFYYLLILIGNILFFIKKTKHAKIILSMGLIFLCLDLIESSLIEIFNDNFVKNFLLKNNTTLYGILSGTIIAFLIQSSSATIILTQKLFNIQAINSLLGISIMLGANIGTTISGLIFSLNATSDGKRVALGSLIFNITGVLLTIPFLCVNKEKLTNLNNQYLISLMHIYFNIITGIIGVFFIKPLCFLCKKLIK